ncbi:transcriptional repressor [Bacteroidia bacterium]|nr:transcriptional repressor [Bacteroidia bacterium]
MYLCHSRKIAMVIDDKTYKEICNHFSNYLTEKNLRKTEERHTILKQICSLSDHFTVDQLEQQLAEAKFHVSKATLYNTIEVLVEGGIIVRHQIHSKRVEYELRKRAETHLHQVCSICGAQREVKLDAILRNSIYAHITRFTPEYFSLYVYGICNKCRKKQKNKNKYNLS